MTQRTERVGDLIRAELAELIRREMRDPRVALASVSAVEVARDFSHAKVKVSTLGTEAERLESITALERAKGFLRRELSRRLTLRTTPELHFELDRGAEHMQRITDLLEKAQTPATTKAEGDGGRDS